jgi:hypothetical protein
MERRGCRKTSNIWRANHIETSKNCILKQYPLVSYSPKPNSLSSQTPNVSSSVEPNNAPLQSQLKGEEKSEFERNFEFYSCFREPFYLISFNHPNIIKPLGFIRETNVLYHVYNSDFSLTSLSLSFFSLFVLIFQFGGI